MYPPDDPHHPLRRLESHVAMRDSSAARVRSAVQVQRLLRHHSAAWRPTLHLLDRDVAIRVCIATEPPRTATSASPAPRGASLGPRSVSHLLRSLAEDGETMTKSSDPRWKLDEHTRAKHEVLRNYLDQWVPIMGYASMKWWEPPPRVLLIDGFAGPGRYLGNEPGSPLIMLDAILSHGHAEKLSEVTFYLYFIEKDPARAAYLEREVQKLNPPKNVTVGIVRGEFADEFDELVSVEDGKVLIPTFAFIDPFGYTQAKMSLSGRFLEFPRSEALFFLPMTDICRFLSRDGQESGLDALFGSPRWRDAIELDGRDRSDFLIDLFKKQLQSQGQVKHVRSFEIRTDRGRDNRLVFATGHDKGLDAMKDAMWDVDPREGQRWEYVAHTQSGQELLFAADEDLDTGPLLDELRAKFGKGWFTIEQAEGVTLVSWFKSSHLKKKTLKRTEQEGRLEVDRSAGQRKGTFSAGTRMRFR
jgi:three-Cys-motif partner protein